MTTISTSDQMNYPGKTDYCRNLQYYAPGTRFSRIFITFNYVVDKDRITPLQKNEALEKMRLDEEKFKEWVEILKVDKLIEFAAFFEEVGEQGNTHLHAIIAFGRQYRSTFNKIKREI